MNSRNLNCVKAGRRIMPTTYFTALLGVALVLHRLFPHGRFLHPPLSYSGYILVIFGVTLNLWTDRLFKENETSVKPSLTPDVLLTSGPFRLTRHPMYLGMFSVLLGVAVVQGTAASFILPAIFAVLMGILFIPMEEENLERIFGEEYRVYASRVRKWV